MLTNICHHLSIFTSYTSSHILLPSYSCFSITLPPPPPPHFIFTKHLYAISSLSKNMIFLKFHHFSNYAYIKSCHYYSITQTQHYSHNFIKLAQPSSITSISKQKYFLYMKLSFSLISLHFSLSSLPILASIYPSF